MKLYFTFVLFLISTLINGQEIDTLSFYSEAFQEKRTVYIQKPDHYKYKSESVELPVFYLLDGQHEWFVNPLLAAIKYLQYTHEIPNALIVIIPHKDRNKECGIVDLNTELALDVFITEELEKELKKHKPNKFKLIVGHSFSASFSLYLYYHQPNFYTSVIANTPLDEIELLVRTLQENNEIDKDGILISIGGIAKDKDYYHRKKYDLLKEKYPDFFNTIHVFEANFSAHNAVPIVSTPMLITKVFEKFSSRYSEIAQVNMNYKLINEPETTEREIQKILTASQIGKFFYPPEIAEINGIASRYWNSDYTDLTTEVYKLGIEYYPNYYDFYLSLYELTLNKDKGKSREYLEKAESLLLALESNGEPRNKIIEEIKAEKLKNDW
ncbi:MAG: hypothetical protein GVX78_00750 [Bacteroidetes bacterium]|jgi:hypothetical protein|nr:hypothetical protein [Bacteroidota bacterium]